MGEVTVSEKGQVAIPVRIRRKYGIQKGTKLRLVEEEDGIKLFPPVNLTKLCGTWKDLDLEEIASEIEEMRAEDEAGD
jgi:AbrB family looped-hinge helix DNA binding protein